MADPDDSEEDSSIDPSKVKVGKVYLFVDKTGRVKPGKVVIKRERPHETTELVVEFENDPSIPAYLRGKSAMWYFGPWWMGEKIYEVPKYGESLALINTKAKLPPELLGEVMSYLKPNVRKLPYPGQERNRAEAARQRKSAEEERQEQEALAAMRTGGKTRRTRRSQTRRRKRFT